ncbi:1119_t:CDS:10 [Entrophospora sp. SA101]|nr:1119_t:CDS:10 [Entrophospora sp. SA101]
MDEDEELANPFNNLLTDDNNQQVLAHQNRKRTYNDVNSPTSDHNLSPLINSPSTPLITGGGLSRRNYLSNPHYDQYEQVGIDDNPIENEPDPAARRRAEFLMEQRDALEAGRPRKRYDEPIDAEEEEGDESLTIEELSDMKANNVLEWVQKPPVKNGIMKQFSHFLHSFTIDGKNVYRQRIDELTAKCPTVILNLFDEVSNNVIIQRYHNYSNIEKHVTVRITNYSGNRTLRQLREKHLNTFVCVNGVITKRTGVFPQLKYVKYNCGKCGGLLGPFTQDSDSEIKINHCIHCESKGPFYINVENTIYSDYQKITLQENPGSVPPGRLPRHREVILFANYIYKTHDANIDLSDEDKRKIEDYSKDPRIAQRIFKSIAPSIYGHANIKRALALSLFGGVPKNIKDKHRLRGDINILMLGDPGTAKSQFLKYIEKTAHRAVFTTGQGASAVGLTASVKKDPVTREWTLEGGALVLADQGICLIDEFDKMNDSDRCAVLAAANPIRGRYNASVPFSHNVYLTEPILSRFDILCVVKDKVNSGIDEILAEFVVASHIRSHPSSEAQSVGDLHQDADLIPQDDLRKYILYAKQIEPTLSEFDKLKVANLYAGLRQEVSTKWGFFWCRIHLRRDTIGRDLDVAIDVVLRSFFSSQKYSKFGGFLM